MRRTSAAIVLLLVLAAVLAALAAPGMARMTGVSGRAQTGCICHGDGTPWDGVEGQFAIVPVLEGVPDVYEPGAVYPLTVEVTGGLPYIKGGFDLNASAGVLRAGAGETNVQITTLDTFGGVPGEATHITPDSRLWKVDWTAPPEGSGDVTFSLATNSVSGDSEPNEIDMWNKISLVSSAVNLAPVAPTLHEPTLGPEALNGTVTVTWGPAPVVDLEMIHLYVGTDERFALTDGTMAGMYDADVTETVLTDLAPGAKLFLRLEVIDFGGLSAESNTVALSLPMPEEPDPEPKAEAKGIPAPGLPLLLVAFVLARRP